MIARAKLDWIPRKWSAILGVLIFPKGSLSSRGNGDPGSPFSWEDGDPGPHFTGRMGTRVPIFLVKWGPGVPILGGPHFPMTPGRPGNEASLTLFCIINQLKQLFPSGL